MSGSFARIIWDKSGERRYETGVSRGVLYPQHLDGTYPLGVGWNGLSSVTESPSGAEANAVYANNSKYLNLMSVEEFGCTIEAYTYPDEFLSCDGSKEIVDGAYISQQPRTPFGLCYRTELGNDTSGIGSAYKLHLVYGATASPSEKAYQTISDNPEAIAFSWEVTTVPVEVTGFKPTALLTIDSTKTDHTKLLALEDILYGSATAAARLPLPSEIMTLLAVG